MALAIGALAMASLAACGEDDNGSQRDPAGDEVALRLQLEPGATFRQTVATNQVIRQSLPNQEVEVTQEIVVETVLDVLEAIDNGPATVRIGYNRVVFSETSEFGSVSYDSATGAEDVPPEAEDLAANVGLTLDAVVSQEGRVLNLESFEDYAAGILDWYGLTDVDPSAIGDALGPQYTQEATRAALEASFAVYPTQPVAPGDSWPIAVPGSPFGVAGVVDYRLDQVADGTAMVSVSGDLATPGDGYQVATRDGSTVIYRLGGTQSGSAVFDLGTGWVTASTVSKAISGDITSTDASGSELGWPMSIRTEVVVTTTPQS